MTVRCLTQQISSTVGFPSVILIAKTDFCLPSAGTLAPKRGMIADALSPLPQVELFLLFHEKSSSIQNERSIGF
jgi:hypothetical protein